MASILLTKLITIADSALGEQMKQHDGSVTRRSTLLGLSASIATTLPDRSYGQAGGKKILEQGAAKEGRLTLLVQTSATDETLGAMIKKFRSRYPFVNVGYTIQSTQQIMNRFTAELTAKRGITDWLTLPSNLAQTGNYIAKNAVAPFVISHDEAYPDGAKYKGLWYALAVERTVTVYRKGALSEAERRLVRTYKGLGDARFRGRLGIDGITNSVAVTASYVLQNNPDKDLWQGLVANKPRVKTASPALLDGLLSGQYDVSVFSSWASAATPAQNGAPIEFGNTALSPTIYVPCGISAQAPHPNAARLWQDWILSQEGQNEWVRLVGMSSVRSDVIQPWARRQPWFFDTPGSHKPLDWVDFSNKQAQVIARFNHDLQAA
jgi:ABC-type Fe3+ transport system substrate-binding protein